MCVRVFMKPSTENGPETKRERKVLAVEAAWLENYLDKMQNKSLWHQHAHMPWCRNKTKLWSNATWPYSDADAVAFLLRRPGCLKMCNTMIDATWPVILVTCEATTNATSRSRLVSKQIHLQWNSWNWWDWSFAEHRVLKPKQNRFCYTANARTLTGKALLVFHSSNPEQRTPPRDQVSSFTASPPNLGDSVAADISCKPTQSVKGTLVPSNKCEAMCNTSEITSRYTSQTWYKHVLGNLEDIPMHHCI